MNFTFNFLTCHIARSLASLGLAHLLCILDMVYYFSSNTVTPSAFIYVGKDKVESSSLPLHSNPCEKSRPTTQRDSWLSLTGYV